MIFAPIPAGYGAFCSSLGFKPLCIFKFFGTASKGKILILAKKLNNIHIHHSIHHPRYSHLGRDRIQDRRS